MRRGKDRKFRAVQRARRLRGDLGPASSGSGSRDVPGGVAGNVPESPEFPIGQCPDCDLGGPAIIALIPDEQCELCGGYPANYHDDDGKPYPTARLRAFRGDARWANYDMDGEALGRAARQARPAYTAQDHEDAADRLELARLNLMNASKDASGPWIWGGRFLPTDREREEHERRGLGPHKKALTDRHAEVMRMVTAHRYAASQLRRDELEGRA